ncbi:hypothetical protein BJV74DRAFT_826735, partial [Russula compacta]
MQRYYLVTDLPLLWRVPDPICRPFSPSSSCSVNHSFPGTSLMPTAVEGLNPGGKHVACRGDELCVKDGRVTIETLPDEVLLKLFDFYVVDYTGTCVSKMAIYRLCITGSSECDTSLHSKQACEGDAGYLATFAYCH